MEYLTSVHSTLKFIDKNKLRSEVPEQLMAVKYVTPDSVVLELGGSIGRNTCVICSILNDSSNLVTIEPNAVEMVGLERNRQLNDFKFKIEPNILSTIPLYSKGWYTHKQPINGSTKIDCISWDELTDKYNLKFNTLIIDNEGNFVENLKTFPNILENIRLLCIEHDFNTESDLQYFYNTMKTNNFRMIDKHMKTERLGPGMNWSDGLESDPIFISAWKQS